MLVSRPNDTLFHFSITIHHHLACFYATKYLEKKISEKEMLLEQTIEFELRGHGPPGRTYTPITGYFHKTKISKKNL